MKWMVWFIGRQLVPLAASLVLTPSAWTLSCMLARSLRLRGCPKAHSYYESPSGNPLNLS